MDHNEDLNSRDLRFEASDRHYVNRREPPIFLFVVCSCIVILLVTAVYFRAQVHEVWDNLIGSKKQSEMYLKGLSSKLQLSQELPRWVLGQSALVSSLDRLNREGCDRVGIFSLAEALSGGGYPRDGSDALIKFALRCRNGDDALFEAARILADISDYGQVIKITSRLIESAPASSQLRYMRADAFQAEGQFEKAISDYVSTIELVSNTKNVSSSVFTDLANSYASLKRFCEAMAPIQMWIAVDPANRDTTQARTVISEYAKKGNCSLAYATGSDRFFTQGSGTIKAKVEINGVAGTFIIDTGASLVSLDSAFAKRANVNLDTNNRVRLQTANGTTEGLVGVANKVKLGRLTATDVAVVVGMGNSASLGGDIDGLLGMSFLARYEMTVSGRELRLTEKKIF